MRFQMGCRLGYEIPSPISFIFNVEASALPQQTIVSERLTFDLEVEREAFTNPETGTRLLRVQGPAGALTLTYEAEVDLEVLRADAATIDEVEAADVPLRYFPYLLPSRFVPSDRLLDFATREFGSMPRGHQRVSAICNWINDSITYQAGSSDSETTATETLVQRAGVCRDFAHLGIAFCRALGIPARFISCYASGLVPPDFHAVFEAYLGGRWWLFDATRQAELDGLVRIGVGRDAAEVAFATPFGSFDPGPVEVWIRPSDADADRPRTVDAISISE